MTDIDQNLHNRLRDALGHLYDPAYEPAPKLLECLQLGREPGQDAMQRALRNAIGRLAPDSSVPETARVRRLYDLLRLRYIDELTQEETAERLGITPRHLRREQDQAIRMLAERLCAQRASGERATEKSVDRRRSQVRREIASLQRTATGRIAQVDQVLRGVVDLVGPMAFDHHVTLGIESVPPSVATVAPPTALRQILLAVLTDLLRDVRIDRITLAATTERDITTISIRATFGEGTIENTEGAGATAGRPQTNDLLDELLTVHGGTRRVMDEPSGVRTEVRLPAASRVKVLVVDDNPDLVHFYRRYAAGTPYDISAMSEGEHLLETIESETPDVIVLDVMLPDIDGWELLTQVHAHPRGREIPVIVCTVVREQELALSLGAAVFVDKPIRRREFIEALETAISRAATTA